MMTMFVTPATTANIPELVSLVEQYWRFEAIEGFEPTRVRALLARVLADPGLGRAWLARVDGVAAGYLLAVYVFSLEHQGVTAEIDEFFVVPQYRGLGLGSQMLATGEAQFLIEGCTNVSLQIGRGNEAARKFYRRNGFEDRAGYELVSKSLK
jgi:GNAT superfamily N-acetyltransferase